MAFNLSGAFSGALGGAGAGSMFGGVGAPIGAGIGALAGGFLQGKDVDYSMSPEQKAILQNQMDIASGKIEAPEVQQMKHQADINLASQVGAMQANRGATQGAKSAYLQTLGSQQQAQTNEAAVAANAQARQQAQINAANMLSGQQAMNIKSQEAEQAKQSNFLSSMAGLGAFGASQYLNKNKSESPKTESGSSSQQSLMNPYLASWAGTMGQNKLQSSY
jgi:hypothetical protein